MTQPFLGSLFDIQSDYSQSFTDKIPTSQPYLLRFQPYQCTVEIPFWQKLVDKKLDVWRLTNPLIPLYVSHEQAFTSPPSSTYASPSFRLSVDTLVANSNLDQNINTSHTLYNSPLNYHDTDFQPEEDIKNFTKSSISVTSPNNFILNQYRDPNSSFVTNENVESNLSELYSNNSDKELKVYEDQNELLQRNHDTFSKGRSMKGFLKNFNSYKEFEEYNRKSFLEKVLYEPYNTFIEKDETNQEGKKVSSHLKVDLNYILSQTNLNEITTNGIVSTLFKQLNRFLLLTYLDLKNFNVAYSVALPSLTPVGGYFKQNAPIRLSEALKLSKYHQEESSLQFSLSSQNNKRNFSSDTKLETQQNNVLLEEQVEFTNLPIYTRKEETFETNFSNYKSETARSNEFSHRSNFPSDRPPFSPLRSKLEDKLDCSKSTKVISEYNEQYYFVNLKQHELRNFDKKNEISNLDYFEDLIQMIGERFYSGDEFGFWLQEVKNKSTGKTHTCLLGLDQLPLLPLDIQNKDLPMLEKELKINPITKEIIIPNLEKLEPNIKDTYYTENTCELYKIQYTLCCLDSSGTEYPSWPLRNLIYLVSHYYKLYDNYINLLLYRDYYHPTLQPSDRSLLLRVYVPNQDSFPFEELSISPGTNSCTGSLVSGWLLHHSHQRIEDKITSLPSYKSHIDRPTYQPLSKQSSFTPYKSVNKGSKKSTVFLVPLQQFLDPIAIQSNAVDLNIRLIKWRILPSFQPSQIQNMSFLLLGAGALGSTISQSLIAWGVRNITLVDKGRVSPSNLSRQWLYTQKDLYTNSTLGKLKVDAARQHLLDIRPDLLCKAIHMEIPMPGHSINARSSTFDQDVNTLKELISTHNIVLLLTDSRESRWLPSLIAASLQENMEVPPLCITVAIGFESFVVMRHSYKDTKMACYFCNDLTSPTDSISNRTLDQQCTVTRPGSATIASAVAVELIASLSQHPLRFRAPHVQSTPSTLFNTEYEKINSELKTSKQQPSCLGTVPHTIRGSLTDFQILSLFTEPFNNCICCSHNVLEMYKQKGNEFIKMVCLDSSILEQISGLQDLKLNVSYEDVLAFEEDEEII